jgi:hypothetical protein
VNAEMLADQDQAVTVPCPEPRCSALIGEVCINVHTGDTLRHLAAHHARLKAAGVRHAPWDARDLRRGD